MAGAYVVVSLIGFEVFIVVIEANMAASKGLGSFFIVFDVIGLEALISIVNVHVIVRDKKIAAFLLGAARPDLDIAGLGGVQRSLLRNRDW